MMQLQINGDPGQVVWLRRPTYLIGGSSVCNLRFPDHGLEPVHAHLKVRDGLLRLSRQDGALVKVNGIPLKTETLLEHGDQVTLGKVRLAVLDPEKQRGQAGEAGEQPLSGWILHGLSQGLAGRHYTIAGTQVVGRGQDCDIRLAEAHLSRRHARLTSSARGLVVEDMQSSNGTFVNGRRVSKALLKNGDELSLDTVRFRVIHRAANADVDETAIHGVEGQRKPARPTGPTAIDIQRAALRHMRDDYDGAAALSGTDRSGSRSMDSGWLAIMALVLLLAGTLWAVTFFFGTPFQGDMFH